MSGHCFNCRETLYMYVFQKIMRGYSFAVNLGEFFIYERAITVKPELASYLLLHRANRWLICSV